jgi:hypothetical protein
VLNEKLKRRIEKTRKENQQIIAGAMSDGLSTTVYRTTMVKFLFSRGARRDLTVPPFASLHRNIVMLAVALISIRGGNRHTCVRGSVKHKIIRAYIEERSPMRSAHHHRSCFTGDTGQNPKMTRILRISHFTHFSRKNEVEAFRSVEYKQTNAVG